MQCELGITIVNFGIFNKNSFIFDLSSEDYAVGLVLHKTISLVLLYYMLNRPNVAENLNKLS